MRRVVGTERLVARSGGEHVARAAHRVEERPLEPFLELAAQPADMDVDDVGARIEMIVPDLLEKHGAGDDAALVAGEIFEQQIFARLEVELLAGALHRSRQRIDLEIADGQPMSAGSTARLRARRSSAFTRASSSANEKGLTR